jgi:hypothetical protein
MSQMSWAKAWARRPWKPSMLVELMSERWLLEVR